MPITASTSGCRLLALVGVGEEKLEADLVADTLVVLAPLVAVLELVPGFDLVDPAAMIVLDADVGGAVILLAALGVDVVVHCHKP